MKIERDKDQALSVAFPLGSGELSNISRLRALVAVEAERDFQNARFGTFFPSRTTFEWLTLLTEEVGELAEAMLDYDRCDTDQQGTNLRCMADEATQVAAVAIAIMEWITSETPPQSDAQ